MVDVGSIDLDALFSAKKSSDALETVSASAFGLSLLDVY